jgi:hypothetical protein
MKYGFATTTGQTTPVAITRSHDADILLLARGVCRVVWQAEKDPSNLIRFIPTKGSVTASAVLLHLLVNQVGCQEALSPTAVGSESFQESQNEQSLPNQRSAECSTPDPS